MNLFVYGTLMSPDLFQAVAGGAVADPVAAQLRGFARRLVAGNVVPFIEAALGEQVEGVVWRNLTAEQIARLNLYERAFGYNTQTVTVAAAESDLQANCYIPPDGIIGSDEPWTLEGWEAQHLAPALFAAHELYSHDPLPDPDALRRMWPMMESRAWAKHRAEFAPASVRHAARADDVTIASAGPPAGDFFRMQTIDVHHRTFAGVRSDTLNREIFIAVDAAMVLPYDPLRDKVVLVEQVRFGPAVRRDPNPWMLEPVAGIVDARETPQEAAHREAEEEAGLSLRHLEPVAEFYASPGSTTDYFYTYVGLCDLPQNESYLGGLASEGEDIRLHPMSFSRALGLADSGEIQVGPLLMMLNWLARHRDRIRAMA
ncbi:gamma-glutamylcyclotransferase [Yoonia maritima]|uniref:gamma-glutamylcyclotransferase n=1 Tax=Yoonia maritima TaxID=1435347 RepID=UPI00373547C6